MRKVAQPIVFYDSMCHLCQSIIRFLKRQQGAKQRLRFLPLNSEEGKQARIAIDKSNVADAKTVILELNGHYFVKSEAVIRTLMQLGGAWRLAVSLLLVPRFIRDGIYEWISRNRYRWFGECDHCQVHETDHSKDEKDAQT